MGEETGISWATSTFNTHWGCVKVSEACQFCYAESTAAWRGFPGLWTRGGPRRQLSADYWKNPARWNRKAAKLGQPWRVFLNSMSDIGEDHPVARENRARMRDIIAETPHLTWMLLSKRRVDKWIGEMWTGALPRNVWLGCTVETPKYLGRLEAVLDVDAAVHWVSYEPALEFVDFLPTVPLGLDWLVIGGESGQHARGFNVNWLRHYLNNRVPGLSVFFKQLGALRYDPAGEFTNSIKDVAGAEPSEWPEWMRVQEFPA